MHLLHLKWSDMCARSPFHRFGRIIHNLIYPLLYVFTCIIVQYQNWFSLRYSNLKYPLNLFPILAQIAFLSFRIHLHHSCKAVQLLLIFFSFLFHSFIWLILMDSLINYLNFFFHVEDVGLLTFCKCENKELETNWTAIICLILNSLMRCQSKMIITKIMPTGLYSPLSSLVRSRFIKKIAFANIWHARYENMMQKMMNTKHVYKIAILQGCFRLKIIVCTNQTL